MRLELSGSIERAVSQVLVFSDGDTFTPADYLDQGYTNYDIICIAAGGGRGGGIDTANTGTHIRNYGGEGGGGGYQRVQGYLRDLPTSCPVAVGAAGSPGTDHNSNPSLLTDGTDGGYSSFNTDTCQASGGKGGKRAQSNSATVDTSADGGDGGIGNTITAGGGGDGGVCGSPGEDPSSIDGIDGPIIDDIGHGGGGGAGGIASYTTGSILMGSAGGRGSYIPDDVIVTGNGEDVQMDPETEVDDIKPGRGGGANASPVNGLPYIYGRAGTDGAVFMLITSI